MTKTIIHDGKFLRLVKELHWEYVERTSGNEVVYIVPVLVSDKKYAILIKEYRIPMKAYVIGFPAGLVGDIGNESVETAAQRELLEETGFKANRMRYLTQGPPSSGLSPENIHFYLADKLEKMDDGGGDDTESIEVHQIPLEDIDSWIDNEVKCGSVLDAKLYVGLYFISKLCIE